MPGPDPKLVFDVGMHLGEDTDFYLKKGFNVVAFEANPDLVVACKKRFHDAIADGRLQIIEGAIAPRSAGPTVAFYKNEYSVWGTIEKSWAERNSQMRAESTKVEVPRIDIGDIYRACGIPFYLKIDIEGVDRLVLEELKSFEARPQYVSIESEKVDFGALEADLELLRELGYQKFKPVQQSSVPGMRLKTRSLAGDEVEHVFEQHASGPFGEDIAEPWLSLEGAKRAYEGIFRRYRLFGDNTLYQRLSFNPATNIIRLAISILYRLATGYRGPLPGWHDIHASR